MLKKLLQLVINSDTQSTQALAHQLGVTAKLVDDMLANLALQGYLRDVNATGQMGCASGTCSMRSGCNSNPCDNPKVWEVTEKGKKLLGMNNQ